MLELAALLIGDPPGVWADLGFVVDAGPTGASAHVSGVQHVLGGERRGIRDWALRGIDGPDIDGLRCGLSAHPGEPTPDHPNGVVALDHVVLLTPDVGRTTAALEAAGVGLRRTRETGLYGAPMRQCFFKLGEVVLELVGPAEPNGDGPPRFYGLAWTVRDLDATAAFLGPRLHPAKAAVQPGRRIATLDKSAGSSVSMAFMSAGVGSAG